MLGMNLIFHVAAAVALMFLVYLLLSQRQQIALLRTLFRKDVTKAVVVSQPDSIIEKICRSLGVDVQNHSNSKTAFRKVNLSLISQALQAQSVQSVEIASEQGITKIQVFIAGVNNDNLNTQQLLTEALGKGVEVVVKEVTQ